MPRPMTMMAVAAVLTLTFVAGVLPARATVTMTGDVKVWNSTKNIYEPLKNARVRLVIGEYNDWDTFDVEGSTDASGTYRVTKGNAWWRDGYDTYLIVFAEVNNKLEVQSHYMQIDGYQAVSGGYFSHDSATTTRNLNIGGPSANTDHFQVGGVAALDNSDRTDATHGWRAFFLCRELTDHRLQLVSDALSEGNFEEKEVSFPEDTNVASYVGILDYIRYPDLYFSSGNLPWASNAARHELSHGIMADEFFTWPGWMHGNAGSHTLDKVSDYREYAWSEAWAEFMAEVTQQPRWGNYYDFETQDASWRAGIPAGADRSKVEGEVASCMWDIYDSTGWEKRYEQVSALPGDEVFYDGISDLNLDKIWSIFSEYHPHAFSHESYLGSPDNIVHYWLEHRSYGLKHELKAIMFNRGVRVPELPQSRPTLSVGTVTWTGSTAHIPVVTTESDSEDRTRVRLELFVNGGKVYSQWLSSGWSGATNSRTVDQSIVWRTGDPQPQVIVAVHDDMQTSYVTRTLNPPAGASVSGVVAEVLSVAIRREVVPPLASALALGFGTLQDVVLNVVGRDGTNQTSTRMPQAGGWALPTGEGELRFDQTTQVLSTNNLRDWVEVSFTTTGRDGSTSLNQTVTDRYLRSGNFGLGTHQKNLLTRVEHRTWMLFFSVECRTTVDVVYQIRPVQIATFVPVVAVLLKDILPPPISVVARPSKVSPRLALGAAQTAMVSTSELTGQETPTVLLSRSSQLMDEYARLQARTLEASQELEAKLGAAGPPTTGTGMGMTMGTGMARPTVRQPFGAPIARPIPSAALAASGKLFRPDMMTSTGVLKLPSTTFLDKTIGGAALGAKSLDDDQRSELQALRLVISQGEARMAAISTQSDKLRGALASALQKLGQDPLFDAPSKQFSGTQVNQMTAKLSAVPPSVVEYRPLLSKQNQVIDRGLALPR